MKDKFGKLEDFEVLRPKIHLNLKNDDDSLPEVDAFIERCGIQIEQKKGVIDKMDYKKDLSLEDNG